MPRDDSSSEFELSEEAPPDEGSSELPGAPPTAANHLQSFEDFRRALGDAALLGYLDNDDKTRAGRPRRTGHSVAKRLCSQGSWTKRDERNLKNAYLAGYDYAAATGRGANRKPARRK